MKQGEVHIKERLVSGDPHAFEQLFECYWHRTYTFCLYYTRDRDDAKDLTQTVFAQVWQNRERLSEVENLEHYMAGIARFQSFNFVRKKLSRNQKLEGIDLSLNILPPHSPDPEQLLEYKQLFQETEKIIDTLPEPGRTIFILNRYEELTYREIALQRGISVRTVQYHISAMLRILRKKITNS